MLIKRLHNWRAQFLTRKQFNTFKREPFYNVASTYLPVDKNAIILDIGAGDGSFAKFLNLSAKYTNLYLLDGNNATVESLNKHFRNVVCYRAPDPMPFEAHSVHYIHCSHLIEHLYPEKFYLFVKEMDRVLCKDGILAISTPLLHEGFYSDLSHIKPYYPSVFINYLCKKTECRSAVFISSCYSVENLVFRYKDRSVYEDLGSTSIIIDIMLKAFRKLTLLLGIRKYHKNGYTLVLKKG